MLQDAEQQADQKADEEWQTTLVKKCEAGDLDFVKSAVEEFGADRVFNAQARSVSSVIRV